MTKTAKQIIQDIDAHLAKSRTNYYSNFYIGITDNIEERLFSFHKVPKKGHWYIYRQAPNDAQARVVERYYLDKGMDGGEGGSKNAIWVYCYKISNETNER
jgi:hypothetical protein